MVLKKQTVWLLTMLSLMVVLSAYYLFNHEAAELPADLVNNDEGMIDMVGDMESDFTSSLPDGNEFFLTQNYEKQVRRAAQLSDYWNMLSKDVSAEVINETMEKISAIEHMADAEFAIESMLKTEGFEEALVIADAGRVNVVVKAEELDNLQVVKIINLVREHLDVAGHHVKVTLHN